MEQEQVCFNFSKPDQIEWLSINDVVMGGLSSCSFTLHPWGIGEFSGEVSLENNGGFASVRSKPELFDLEGFMGIKLQVKGDGKVYQFRLKTDKHYDGLVYKTEFQSQTDWQDIFLPFSKFKASLRGNEVYSAPDLNLKHIYQFGFLISNKQAGPFSLEVKTIIAYR